jgi:hypothetical protein
MLPSSIKTPEAAAIIALKSRELGIPLMVGFSHIVVINGKPGMSAELIQAQARKNLPGLVFNIVHTDDKICTVSALRPERGSTVVKVSFSIEDARKAKLLGKDVWIQYPAAMLRARAITACLRAVCPDALMGVSYTPEELGAERIDLGGPDAIPTTARPVGASIEGQKMEGPEESNVIDMTGGKHDATATEQEALDHRRKAIWSMWKSAKGTQEGFAKYIYNHFDKMQSGHALTLAQLAEIEHYISNQLNSRPPQPVDPVEATPSSDDAWMAEASEPIPTPEQGELK